MFIPADVNRIYYTLNVLRVADFVLFLSSVDDTHMDIDHLITCILGQGMPPHPAVGIVDLDEKSKKVTLGYSGCYSVPNYKILDQTNVLC